MSKETQAIQTMEAFIRNIAFGDAEVTDVFYGGHRLIIQGKYTEQAKENQSELLIEDVLEQIDQHGTDADADKFSSYQFHIFCLSPALLYISHQ